MAKDGNSSRNLQGSFDTKCEARYEAASYITFDIHDCICPSMFMGS